MGLLDSFLDDIKRETQRIANSVDIAKSGAQNVVKMIDSIEDSVNKLAGEDEVTDNPGKKPRTADEAVSKD